MQRWGIVMARITDIRRCNRLIHADSRTVMDVNSNGQYFSMWVRSAGQETGMGTYPLSIQLDAEMAAKLRGYLEDFLNDQGNK